MREDYCIDAYGGKIKKGERTELAKISHEIAIKKRPYMEVILYNQNITNILYPNW